MRKARMPIVFAASILMLATPTLTNAQPDHVQLGNLVNRGNALLRANHFQEAIQTYQKALDLDPNCAVAKDNIAETYNNWGIFYFKQHKFREALEQLDKCLSLKPGHANARRNLSIVNNAASQLGVNLDETEAVGPGGAAPSTVAGFNPLTGAAIDAKSAPTGNTQTKPTQKSGAMLQAGITSAKAQTPKTAPEAAPSAGAVVLTPGMRVESPPEDSFTTVGGASSVDPTRPVTSPNSAGTPATSSTPYKASFATGYTPSSTATVTPSTQPTKPDTFVTGVSNSVAAPGGAPQAVTPSSEPPATVPQVPPQAVPAATAGASVDEQLGAVEVKMYGTTQNSLNVMQRLEKMERDVSGQVRSGSIMERINFLKQSIGM